MNEHAVVIAGAGPTGMMLAAELALAKIDVVIIEKRAEQNLERSRAGGLHSRTIEVFDQRGIADRFLAQGRTMQIQGFARMPLDISDFPTRHNYGLALGQIHSERLLAAWLSELGVPFTSRFFIKPPPEADEPWPSCFSFWEAKAWLATVPVRSDPRPIHHLGSTFRQS